MSNLALAPAEASDTESAQSAQTVSTHASAVAVKSTERVIRVELASGIERTARYLTIGTRPEVELRASINSKGRSIESGILGLAGATTKRTILVVALHWSDFSPKVRWKLRSLYDEPPEEKKEKEGKEEKWPTLAAWNETNLPRYTIGLFPKDAILDLYDRHVPEPSTSLILATERMKDRGGRTILCQIRHPSAGGPWISPYPGSSDIAPGLSDMFLFELSPRTVVPKIVTAN